MKRILFILATLLMVATIQGADTYSSGIHQSWVGVMPGAATNIVTGTVYLQSATFSTAGSSGTITVTDRSGQCSGNCYIANGVSIAANSTYIMQFADDVMPSGISITSTGTVHARIHWTTTILHK